MLSFDEIKGKTLLAGINMYDKNRRLTGRRRYFGTVTAAGVMGIKLKCADGNDITLPPNIKSVYPAEAGKYSYTAPDGTVHEPDFVTIWDVEVQEKKENAPEDNS